MVTRGSIVKRKSYGLDIAFKIVHVFPYEKLAILEAITEQRPFFADAAIDDLIEANQLP